MSDIWNHWALVIVIASVLFFGFMGEMIRELVTAKADELRTRHAQERLVERGLDRLPVDPPVGSTKAPGDPPEDYDG